MLKHEAGHLIIDPVFASVAHYDEEADCFIAIDFDDCECEPCVVDRGPIPMYATVSIGLVAGKTRISQRLTAKEARRIGKTLINFAKVVDDVAAVGKEDLA